MAYDCRMTRPIPLLLAAAVVAALACRGRATQPATDTPAPTVATEALGGAAPADSARHEADIQRFEAADRDAPPAPGGVLFTGSSSFRLWPELARDFAGVPVLNRAFGGSTLPEVIHYAPRIVVPYRPRMIVLYAGDNDIADGRSPAQVAADYRAFVALVRRELPRARIVFVSIKPSPSRWALVERVREANRLVQAEVARDRSQSYVDVFTPMLGADGRPRPELFVGDSLHMAPAGYALWRERLAAIVR
jgi:lysophospholipase L1-like esterase